MCPQRSRTFRATFPPVPAAVPTARRAVETFLRRHALEDALVDDVALVASELCTNAVEAGHGVGFDVDVEVDHEPAGVTLRVANDAEAAAIPTTPHLMPRSPLASRGRGLGIAAAVATRVDFRDIDGRLVVSAEFR